MQKKFDVIYWDDNESKVITKSFNIKPDAEFFVEHEFTFNKNKTFIKIAERIVKCENDI